MSSSLCFRCLTLPKSQGNSYCLPCSRDLLAESLERDPRWQAVLEARSAPCVDCGQSLPPFLMDLDHVRGRKGFTLVATVIKKHSLAQVLAEIEKCEPRCVVCHRTRHYNAPDPNDGRDRERIAQWTAQRDSRAARRIYQP